MPKLKTKKALKKRIRLSAGSKIKRARAGRSHLMRKKSSRRRLKLKRAAYLEKVDQKKVRRMLPYG